MLDPDSDSAFNASQLLDSRGQMQGPRNYVKFYRQWVRNNFMSKQEGCEVGEEQDFILIISPGQAKTEVRRKASDADKQMYAQEWSAYQQGKEHQISGTPIELLPGLPHGIADALKAMYIYTIEQMAELPDLAMQKVGMGGNEIRQKAKAYLSGGGQAVVAMKAELEEARITIATQRTTIEMLEGRVRELEAPKPRGRRKKVEARLAS